MADTIDVAITLGDMKLSDSVVDRLRAVAPEVKVRVQSADKQKDIPNRFWMNADVLLTNFYLPPHTLNTRIKWVHAIFAGVDNILADPFITSNPEIIVTNSSGIHASKVGEHAVGMMLALGHRFPLMFEHQQGQKWAENRLDIFRSKELAESTVGILGYGRIGREIARLCKSFGATVLATKRNVMNPADDRYTMPGTGDPEGDLADRLYPPEATAFMVKECDFVVITLPLTEQTRGSFNQRIFDAMKETAYLINVGRGGIVDEDALLAVLNKGGIAGAAFDVFNEEPLPPEHPFWKTSNMVISPHVSGNMPKYSDKAAAVFEENLRRFVEGHDLINEVDRELGY